MSQVQTMLLILQLVLAIGNIAIIGYGFYKFLNRPHDDIKERVTRCEEDIKDIKQSLYRGDGRFQELDRALKVIITATRALIEFEVQYCLLEHKELSKGLEKAKEALDEYIS